MTDAQAEAKANPSFVDSLIENFENQCDSWTKLGGHGEPFMSEGGLTNECFSLSKKKRFHNTIVFFSFQCKQYVSQYGSLVITVLMSMVSVLLMHLTFTLKNK